MIKQIKQFNNNINTKNIWKDNYPPKDFFQINNKYDTSNWIGLFYNYEIVTIKLENWMINARKLSSRFNIKNFFSKNIKSFSNNFRKKNDIFDYNYSYYVMTNKGNINNKLYCDIESIILDLITSDISTPLFSIYQKKIVLYLINLNKISKDDCFRIFIKNYELKGISQLFIYKKNKKIKKKIDNNNEYLTVLAEKIINVYYKQIYPVIKDIYQSCVIDIRINDYFWNILDIKPNGKKYGTNSCLFSWYDDNDLLENIKYSNYIHYVNHFRVSF
tara:strand:- start:579 stop:1400 length:822 start_codon:yes stop_codon:yes gene_type:complete